MPGLFLLLRIGRSESGMEMQYNKEAAVSQHWNPLGNGTVMKELQHCLNTARKVTSDTQNVLLAHLPMFYRRLSFVVQWQPESNRERFPWLLEAILTCHRPLWDWPKACTHKEATRYVSLEDLLLWSCLLCSSLHQGEVILPHLWTSCGWMIKLQPNYYSERRLTIALLQEPLHPSSSGAQQIYTESVPLWGQAILNFSHTLSFLVLSQVLPFQSSFVLCWCLGSRSSFKQYAAVGAAEICVSFIIRFHSGRSFSI